LPDSLSKPRSRHDVAIQPPIIDTT
jgi:hypothetical protein